ncbi:nucleotidyltransferase domain-containing protein [Salegentibacter sp. F188]|uniref:Nucleotidyltransferase domain-containing protein n=1 Tax=Autumnicola patrickiae TaxID=3075591 RepID=A0ABU3DZF1_9FLAO|nr:nucleotidyltransferase domain-containing protein [Salegentibacter sp. F188]MDT0689092.1 nucleotidyltransferase domain-containing protein [Salegentibacter sp. F188]
MEYGLKDNVLLKIRKVLSSFSGIEEAVIYGSRGLGTYREGSDIDIALKDKLSFEELLKIEKKLDDLMLPCTLDLSIYHKLSNKDLQEH